MNYVLWITRYIVAESIGQLDSFSRLLGAACAQKAGLT
jgi:hypothetical protein